MVSTILLSILIFVTLCRARSVRITLGNFTDPVLHRSSGWGDQPTRTARTGESVWFAFTGNAVRIELKTYYSYGIVEVNIDGTKTRADLYRSEAEQPHVKVECVACYKLENGPHNVTLTLVGSSVDMTSSGGPWMVLAELWYDTDEPLPTVTSGIPSASSRPEQQSDSSEQSQKRSYTGPIIGGVFSAILLILLILAGVLWQRRRRRMQLDRLQAMMLPEPLEYRASAPTDSVAYSPTPASRKGQQRQLLSTPLVSSHTPSGASGSYAAGGSGSRIEDTRELPGRDGQHNATTQRLVAEIAELRDMMVSIAHPPQYAQ